jgi:hypothetical protein
MREQGRIQDFKLGGRTWKNCAERREARKFLGYFVWKITILRQKIIFFTFLGGRAPGASPPLDPRLERLQRTKILEDKHQY